MKIRIAAESTGTFAKILSLMHLLGTDTYFVLEGREYAERELDDPLTAPKSVPINIENRFLTVEMILGTEELPENVNCQFVARVWYPVEYMQATTQAEKEAIVRKIFAEHLQSPSISN